MLKIEKRNIRLDLYCIVDFFDRLFSENKEPVDQKQYLSAIGFAEKSVQSMTNIIKENPNIFNKISLSEEELNIFQIPVYLLNRYRNSKEMDIIRIVTDVSSLHPNLIKKFNNNPNIQNYLLSVTRLNILNKQSSNLDRTEETLDDYKKFVAEIKTIPEIKKIWDDHQ